MRHLMVCIVILVLSSGKITLCQFLYDDKALELEKLYNRLIISNDDTDRLRINDSIILLIDQYVTTDKVFSHNFTNLKYLGQITSPDSLLKIITWNLVLKNSPGRYYCYLLKKSEKENKNLIYRLKAGYSNRQIDVDTTYTESDWYGALYYDIKPFTYKNTPSWVLLGIDFGNSLITKKIIEVVSFEKDSAIIFGRKWFDSGEKLKFREVFEYASTGMMSLRFNSDKSIVFDHLVPFIPVYTGDHQYYGPDYSYDAYNFENGLWILTINVDVRNY